MDDHLFYRSVLFVGGLSIAHSDDLAQVLAAGADCVCVDLEDAVPPASKARARLQLLDVLPDMPANRGRPALCVRINSLRTMEGIADLQALLGNHPAVDAVLLPKVQSADEIRWASALAESAGSDMRFHCIIETVDGLANCSAIAAAHPRLTAMFFGGFDMSTALGAQAAWEPLLYARSQVVLAAAGAGIPLIDSPFQDLADPAGLTASACQARALGMTGKTAKHAAQVAAINAAFTPDAKEISRAREIVARFTANPAEPLVYEGKLVELPTIKRLRRIADAAPR